MTSTDTSPQIADTLPKRTARRRKIHEDTLRAHPGKWVRLQKVSESGNATQYKKTYGDEFDFGIRRDIEHNRWLWGTFLAKPVFKVLGDAKVTKIIPLDDTGRPTGPNYVGDIRPHDDRAVIINTLHDGHTINVGPAVPVTTVAEARALVQTGMNPVVATSIQGSALAEDIQAVIDEAKLDA